MEQKDMDMIAQWSREAGSGKEQLIRFAERHPEARLQDYVKRIYQAEFGGGHMIEDEQKSLAFLKEEIAGLTEEQLQKPYLEPFCGTFACVNLSVSKELSPERINRLFVVSSTQVSEDAPARFDEKLWMLLALCEERGGLFPFSRAELEAYMKEFSGAGKPLLRHSEAYRRAYAPAYRVVRREFAQRLPLYLAIERCLKEKGRVSIAIDGDSAAGKTETARWLQMVYDCNVFHADDFFLPRELRTPEHLAEPGGNMDRVRFQKEICEPVQAGTPFSYRPFSCQTMRLGEPVPVEPKKINVFEGSYTMHPDLRGFYDVKVFLSIDPAQQRERILNRNGSKMLQSFTEQWIPMEKKYQEVMRVKEACGLVF